VTGNTRMQPFRFVLLAGIVIGAVAAPAVAQVSFQGKTISMIVGYPPGGGTDTMARLNANFLPKLLPGAPTIVVRNVPGAEGMTAMNYFVQQVVPDGLTIATASNTAADPLNYRKPQSHYDPTQFEVVGGVGRGGTALVISKEAVKRLHDKQATPVVMGTPAGVQRSGMQMAAWGIEYLGWNARWVSGYRGTSELMLALERGEIDMTATANLYLLQKLIDTGRFEILVQTGSLINGALVTRPDFHDAPILEALLKGRISDPLAQKAFEYWETIATMDKWLALPPKTPAAILAVYRDAYAKMIQDPDFVEQGRKTSDDFVPLLYGDVERQIRTLGQMPPQTVDFIGTLLRRQGLEAQ
jgi:tripartite-type tricarboxylate transporter receptor subunit TctC